MRNIDRLMAAARRGGWWFGRRWRGWVAGLGLSLLTTGCGMIYSPLYYIVPGLALLALALDRPARRQP